MLSPYGMEIVESCITCKLRTDRIFCDLPEAALQAFAGSSFKNEMAAVNAKPELKAQEATLKKICEEFLKTGTY